MKLQIETEVKNIVFGVIDGWIKHCSDKQLKDFEDWKFDIVTSITGYIEKLIEQEAKEKQP